MKKLIAMLLALAIVASFGVTAAFADIITWQDSVDWSKGWVEKYGTWASNWDKKAGLEDQVSSVYESLETALFKNGKITPQEYAEAQAKLDALAKSYATYSTWNGALTADIFDLSNVDWTSIDSARADLMAAVVVARTAEENSDNRVEGNTQAKYDEYTFLKTFLEKQAKAEADAAALAAANAAAKEAYYKTNMTAGDKLIYDMQVQKNIAEQALKNAKAEVEVAKASLEQAKKAAKMGVDAKVAAAYAAAYGEYTAQLEVAVANIATEVHSWF